MKIFRITAMLVPAERYQLIDKDGKLRETRSVFYKRHGMFSGPRFLEYEYLDEVQWAVGRDFLYIIKFTPEHHPGEVKVAMRIRQADADDFKWAPGYPKYERVYYYNPEGNKIEGPLYYMEQTDKSVFNARLASGRLFVPAEGQRIQPYQDIARAS